MAWGQAPPARSARWAGQPATGPPIPYLEAADTEPDLASAMARLAQSAERKALNLVVVGSSPAVGVLALPWFFHHDSSCN